MNNNVCVLNNLYEDFLERVPLTNVQKDKAAKTKELLADFVKASELSFYKAHINTDNKIEFIACSFDLFVDEKFHAKFVQLNELCDIDIDTKALEDTEMTIKFTVKED